MIKIKISDNPDELWNIRLLNSKEGNIYQTKEYSEFLKQTRNWIPQFLSFINEKKEIVGQLMYAIVLNDHKNLVTYLKSIRLTKEKKIFWVYGPIIFNDSYQIEIMESLKKIILQQKYSVTCSEHPLRGGLLSNLKNLFKYEEWGTYIIDLKDDKESIWRKMNKNSAQNNIKRSIKKNVIVKEMTKNELKNYHKILNDTKLKANSYQNYERLEKFWNILSPIGLTGFLSYHNDTIIGGIMFSNYNGYINEWGIARTDKDTKEKLYSQDLLKWKIIEWGIKKGSKYYDLTGINPTPKNQKEIGIMKYKQKWGGEMKKYGIIKK